MLTPERCQELFEKVMKHSDADETEVSVGGGASALTRFANSTIHQNVADESYHLSVRTVYAGGTARATTNKFDDEAIARVVADSAAVAKQQQRDPNLLPMPGPSQVRAVDRYCAATAETTPEARAAAVRHAVDIAKANGQTAAGIFSTGTGMHAILNSRGLSHYYRETHAEFSITMLGQSSSGWAKSNSPDVRSLGVEQLAERASHKANASAAPKEVPPGRYTVILEPAAVLDLVGFLFWDWGGRAVLDQRSFLNERLGQKLFGQNITITDNVYYPLQSGPPFDGEGVPRQVVTLAEGGVIKNLVYARETAMLAHAQPTGHGFPLPNEYGEMPLNIVFSGGDATIEQMIASTERGILVTRLWYIREVDPYQKILTGMTRDGTFLIAGGQVRHGVLNFRFNESLIEMLSKVEMMSAAERAAGEESFEMVVPAMKVADFNFTEVTKF